MQALWIFAEPFGLVLRPKTPCIRIAIARTEIIKSQIRVKLLPSELMRVGSRQCADIRLGNQTPERIVIVRVRNHARAVGEVAGVIVPVITIIRGGSLEMGG